MFDGCRLTAPIPLGKTTRRIRHAQLMNPPVRKIISLPDGNVSTLQWENTRPLFHFAHATGFNAQTYSSLLSPLADRFRIVASDLRGHGFTTLPVTAEPPKHWTIYRHDLLQILDQLESGSAILSGHSMGATVSMMAAALRPERVRALVLLEPVMMPRAWAVLQRLASTTGRNSGPDLADRAALRRNSFPSLEAARASYTGRGAFRSWPDEMLRDYLEGGLVSDPHTGAMHLACKPSWEAATFRAAPFGIAHLVRRISCPVIAINGTLGSTCAASEAALLERAGARIVTIDGASHFLPMEFPQRVRDEIARLADSL